MQIADLAGGAQAAVIDILAALLERARSGTGARLIVSMTHNAHRFVAHRVDGDPMPRLLTGGVACYRIYETGDGRHVTVAALEPKFWQNLCELIGRPELLDRAYDTELPELAELFRTRSLAAWLDATGRARHVRRPGAYAQRGSGRARVSAPCACHAPSATTNAPPASISRACAAIPNATASLA